MILNVLAICGDTEMDHENPPTREAEDLPIYINGDTSLIDVASSKGWEGSGTLSDPYVMEGTHIDPGANNYAIKIESTGLHLKIKECNIAASSSSLDGICLLDCSNITIESCSLYNLTSRGIGIEGSYGITVIDTDISNSGIGLSLSGSTECMVEHSVFMDNRVGLAFSMCCVTDISWNTVGNSVNEGISVSYSNSLHVHHNSIFRSGSHGIRMTSTSLNRIYSNSLLYNQGSGDEYDSSHKQVYDDTELNCWFEKGGDGNYFRDMSFPDSNADDIVDQPYTISGVEIMDPRPLTTSPVRTLPGVPLGPRLKRNGTSIEFMWNRPADIGGQSITGFKVYRKAANMSFSPFQFCDGNSYGIKDNTAIPGTTYSYYVYAENPTGIGNPTEPVSIYLEEPSPLVILGPSEGRTYNTSFVSPSWRFDDKETGLDHFEVRMDQGGFENLAKLTSTRYHNLEDGAHEFTVRGFLLTGGYEEATVSFEIDKTPPEVSILYPENREIISSETLKVEYRCSDEFSGTGKLWIKLDSGIWWECTPFDSYLFRSVTDSHHRIRFKGSDCAGNTAETMIDITVDTSPPSITIDEPDNGTYFNVDGFYLTWTTQDFPMGINRVMCRVDDRPWTDATDIDRIHLEPGQGWHNITMMSEDNLGFVNTTSISVFIDSIPPDIVSFGPNGRDIHPNTTVWVEFDEPVDPNNLSMEVDGLNVMPIIEGRTVRWSDLSGLSLGDLHTVRVWANDIYGNRMEPYSWDFRTKTWLDLNIATLTGRVIDPEGEYLSDVKVYYNDVDYVLTDEDGYFMVELPPGNLTIKVRTKGFEETVYPVAIGPAEEKDIGQLMLEAKEEDPVENDPSESIPIYFILIIAVVIFSFFIIVILMVLIFISKRRSSKPKEVDIEQERKRIYSEAPSRPEREIPVDIRPSSEEEEALLSHVPEEEVWDEEDYEEEEIDIEVDGELVLEEDEDEVYSRSTVFDQQGIDLSVLDEDTWEEMANPLYDIDIGDETPLDEMNCYQKLNIDEYATISDVRRAYRTLALLYHPDRTASWDPVLKQRAQEEMTRLNYAKYVLTDPVKREEHDRILRSKGLLDD